MDFFERVLHIAPDGGSGILEATYVVAGLIAIGVFACRRYVRAHRVLRSRREE